MSDKNGIITRIFWIEEYEDGEEYEDQDDEDNIEPLIKYNRLKGFTSRILTSGDTFTSLAISVGFIYLGTKNGMIYVLNEKGESLKTIRAHTSKVNCLDVDSKGDYLVSGSDDGKVVIIPLKGGDQTQLTHSSPILVYYHYIIIIYI